jgi:2-polyprenyl-3-methyl-5-hydroxy-6-metoxy-1,4-benzoquinol methylase
LRKTADVAALSASDFAISDARYGRTAAIHECAACGFLQCSEMVDVLQYYAEMVDEEYEATRDHRRLQAARFLRDLQRIMDRDLRGMRLLDVGAGSGPLVQEAMAAGLLAEGIEPSRWLHERAFGHGVKVHHGVLPHPEVYGVFDIVTLVDVVEHTPRPSDLLRAAAAVAGEGGVLVVVTPDVSSIAARLMGWRWWHYRLPHVGYYNRQTLERLCAGVGLEPVGFTRPRWVLPLSYLAKRLGRYLPWSAELPFGAWGGPVSVMLNLHDSMLLCVRRQRRRGAAAG